MNIRRMFFNSTSDQQKFQRNKVVSDLNHFVYQ